MKQVLTVSGKIAVLSLGLISLLLLTHCKSNKVDPEVINLLANPQDGPPAGNLQGKASVPAEAGPENVSTPDQVVGNGTPESCTCAAFVEAVKGGGKITFNCGPNPVIIKMDRTAKVFNNAKPDVIIDGGGLVTLSGEGRNRILYMNTCDENQVFTTSHCQNQDHPRLTVQNITFANGNSTAESEYNGGGAIWVRGGRFKAVNCRFFNNVCAATGADLGGGAIRIFSQYNGLPVNVTNCTFGGADGYGNRGSNGGAISSIDVSWTVRNSLFTHNKAIGNGGNPAQGGTPGGGSGGAVYNDGNRMTLSVLGSIIENNEVNAYGSGIFFVSNDKTGNIRIDQSTIRNNQGGSWYPLYKGISMHAETPCEATNSDLESSN